MIRGRIIGEVWATRKHPAMAGRKLVMVEVIRAAEQEGGSGRGVPTGEVVVAIDTLDAAPGQEVLVSWGSGARNAVSPRGRGTVLADAAVSVVLAEVFEKTW